RTARGRQRWRSLRDWNADGTAYRGGELFRVRARRAVQSRPRRGLRQPGSAHRLRFTAPGGRSGAEATREQDDEGRGAPARSEERSDPRPPHRRGRAPPLASGRRPSGVGAALSRVPAYPNNHGSRNVPASVITTIAIRLTQIPHHAIWRIET